MMSRQIIQNKAFAERKNGILSSFSIATFAIAATLMACRNGHLPSLSTGQNDYLQVNLVADEAGFGASRIDTNLANPWGIAISPKGSIWISCNHSGRTVIYDGNGIQTFAPVAIPFRGVRFGGSPVGVVFNGTTDFVVNSKIARFIYVTEEGTVAAWTAGDSTVTVADRSYTNAVYKGIAIANDGFGNFIYAADFHNGKIDVFDKSFNYVSSGKPFNDPALPAGYAPFNIRNIDGMLYVLYAMHKAPENKDDQKGTGNGFVNIFSAEGLLVKRFATQGPLNSPWGIAQIPDGFGQQRHGIMIANFGDGRINVFDSTGAYIGPLENEGIPIVIDGLWDIAFSSTANNQLFFTAGPSDEKYGLFGYLKLK